MIDEKSTSSKRFGGFLIQNICYTIPSRTLITNIIGQWYFFLYPLRLSCIFTYY